jgi:single-stranded-DNA-specific exonuclease
VMQKEEGMSRGSFRSIPQINIIETIEKCGKHLERFGGHAQAAGISVANEKLEDFYGAMNGLIEGELAGKDCVPEIAIDAEVNPTDIDFELAETLEQFTPFGEGNREPVFLMKNLIIEDLKSVGSTNKHLKLFLRSENGSPKIFETIGFNLNGKFIHLEKGDKVDIIFNLEVDSWNGNKKIQLVLIDLKNAQ